MGARGATGRRQVEESMEVVRPVRSHAHMGNRREHADDIIAPHRGRLYNPKGNKMLWSTIK